MESPDGTWFILTIITVLIKLLASLMNSSENSNNTTLIEYNNEYEN